MTALSCSTMTFQLCSLMPPVQVTRLYCFWGERRLDLLGGTSVAENDTLLSQDPVITLFFKQRLLEAFGNYGFPLL